jgi:hypothetical protein
VIGTTEKEIETGIGTEIETEIATSNETANEAQTDTTRTAGTTIEIVFETKITNIDQNGRDHVRRQYATATALLGAARHREDLERTTIGVMNHPSRTPR